MKLLIIRHAIAEDKDDWARTGASDDDRPLTDDGRLKMQRNASGLRTIVSRIDTLAASPLLRARQTAEIVGAQFGVTDIEITDSLVPTAEYAALTDWLAKRETPGVTAVVGHEPHLSGLATWLLTRGTESRIELKKGAACLIGFDDKAEAGAGRLRWLLAPAQLRSLRGE